MRPCTVFFAAVAALLMSGTAARCRDPNDGRVSLERERIA